MNGLYEKFFKPGLRLYEKIVIAESRLSEQGNPRNRWGPTCALVFLAFLPRVVVAVTIGSSDPNNLVAAGDAVKLAQGPLEQGVEPAPNVLILNDDSLSMDWEIVVEQDAMQKEESLELIRFNGQSRRYNMLFGYRDPHVINYGNFAGVDDVEWGRIAPFLAHSTRQELSGIWRVRNHNYNLIYYNPAIRYDPWPGMTASNPSRAPVDPTTPGITINLTDGSRTNLTVHVPSNSDLDHYFDVAAYLPMYYTWDKSNPNDTNVGANECGQLVEIRANARRRDCRGNPLGGPPLFPMLKDPARTDCSDKNTCTAAEELQNFANWFTFYRRREFVAKAALANVVGKVDGMNLGYSSLNAYRKDSNNNDLYSASQRPVLPVSENNTKQDLYNVIYKTGSNGGTALINALDEAGRYFSCQSGSTFPGANCPSQNNSVAACQKNHTLIMTDGFWRAEEADWDEASGVKTNAASKADNDSSNSPFAGGAFADQNRQGGAHDQWLTVADVAMYYYMNDILPLPNKVAPSHVDISRIVDPTYWNGRNTMHQNMNTYTIGFGVFNQTNQQIGTMTPEGEWIPPGLKIKQNWPRFTPNKVESAKLEDLKHAALNGRGKFFAAKNLQSLSTNLTLALESIASQSGGGVAAAASFNSHKIESGSLIFTAFYDGLHNSGDVVAYKLDPNTGDISTALDNVAWRASEEIGQQISQQCVGTTDSRTLLTYQRNGAQSNGALLNANTSGLTQAQVDWFRGHSRDEASNCNDSLNFRERPASVGVIGDIVHSKPLYVGPPDQLLEGASFPDGTGRYELHKASQKARAPMVAFGANDGLFHVLNANTGKEIVAYMPHRLIHGGDGTNQVTDLLDPEYSHQYYVDLAPAVNDAYIKTASTGPRNWTTLAIGGYRSGGRGYFALDLTDPSEFKTASGGVSNVLWEFSDLDDERLGYTLAPPLIAMTNEALGASDQGNRWRAIFGNGYNSKDGVARLFLLDIEAGVDGWDESTDYIVIDASGVPSAGEEKNGLSAPAGIDVNKDGDIDYAYAGDLRGNVYRFDLTSASGNFSVTKIFTAKDASGNEQPITTKPYVVKHPDSTDSYVVVVSTGSWMTQQDASSTSIQSIYGVVDTPSANGTSVKARSDLAIRHIKNVAVNNTVKRVIVGSDIDWTAVSGWYFDFAARAVGVDPSDQNYNNLPIVAPGERAVREMIGRGGYIFVNTVMPYSAQGCDVESGGAIMAFNPLTGLLDKAIFDFDNNGKFDVANGENIAGEVLGGLLSSGAMISSHLFTQMTDVQGNVTRRRVETNTDPDLRAGRLSWVQMY